MQVMVIAGRTCIVNSKGLLRIKLLRRPKFKIFFLFNEDIKKFFSPFTLSQQIACKSCINILSFTNNTMKNKPRSIFCITSIANNDSEWLRPIILIT